MNFLTKITDIIFCLIFGIFKDIKNSHFDNNYFYNYTYYSNLIGKISELNFKLFYKKKPYIGRYLFSYQWGNNNKKQAFEKIIKKQINNNKVSYLEIGSYAGGSLLTACKMFENLKINYNAFAIDLHDKIYSKEDIDNSNFYKEIENYSTSKKVKELFEHNIISSKYNIKYFQTDIDGFMFKVDLKRIDNINIFYIDAGHMYHDVLNDIKKCKKIALIQQTKNYLIFGDDYGLPYKTVKDEYDETYLYKDTIRSKITGTTFHPGVTKAVHDELGNVRHENGIWYRFFSLT